MTSRDSALTIDCGTCRLRPWRADDAAALVPLADDAEVSRGLADRFPYPYTDEDARTFLRMAIARPREFFAVEVDGALAGGFGIRPGEDVYRLSATLGYWLGRAFWGRGLMSAALGGYTRYAFRAFGYQRLQAMVNVNNPASARVLQKCGYALEGTLRRAAYKRGALVDVWIYARLRDGAMP